MSRPRAARRGDGRAVRKQATDVVELLTRPGPLPGAARDAPGGDAGQRAGRHRVRDRGPRRRAPRPGRGERLLRRPRRLDASTADDGRRRGRVQHDAELLDVFVSDREAARSRARPQRSAPSAPRSSTHQADRLAQRSRSRRSGCRSSSPPTSGSPRSSTLADAFDRAGSSALVSARDRSRERRRAAATSSCAAARGGVGKTTTAAVLAIEGARRGRARGRRHDRPGQAAREHARARRALERAARDRRRRAGIPTGDRGPGRRAARR